MNFCFWPGAEAETLLQLQLQPNVSAHCGSGSTTLLFRTKNVFYRKGDKIN
jgi:hypothetical protein